MTDKAAFAIFELNQTITLLGAVKKKFNDRSLVKELGKPDLLHLQKIYQRVRQLSFEIFNSYDSFDSWVGPMREIDEEQENIRVHRLDSELADNLLGFVQGFRHFKQVDEELERFSQENISLRHQLDEMRQRERTYLSIIETSKSPPPQEIKDILLNSLKRQGTTIAKNLSLAKESKANYDLNVPPDIINRIERLEEELQQVLTNIAELEK